MNKNRSRVSFARLVAVALSLHGLVACKSKQSTGPTGETGAKSATATGGARDYVNIVGSSTVYPFSTVVAEQFGRGSKFKTPKVESTGSGGGLKLFCEGVGVSYPDIANASRRIKPSEVAQCTKNGVKEIVEMKIGYDGIVLANSKESAALDLNLRDLWLALAKDVPHPTEDGKTVPNPHQSWRDVNPKLPDVKIEVLGPPPTSGTRDAFVELAMEGGCRTFSWIAKLKSVDKHQYESTCHTIREDGAFIEAGENDNLIVQKLDANPSAFGLFGFSFLDQNTDKVQAATIASVAPTFETIADGSYPVSRPLYFYVKKAHVSVIPGIKEYLAEFSSDKAWGPDGYLADKGMIPMPEAERREFAAAAATLKTLSL